VIDYERVYRVAQLLLDCACHGLSQTSSGCPPRRCVVPGAEPEVINCCPGAGQLTVHLVRVYPSTSFPVPDTERQACDFPYLVAVYETQVWRCAPVGAGTQAPPCTALNAAAFTTMVDVVGVSSGIACCLADTDSASAVIGVGYRWALGDHETTEVRGGCVGTTLQITVGIPRCWEC